MAYLGKLQINENNEVVIGSMLYGISTSAAADEIKRVVMPAFDSLDNGITIHVRFANANTSTEYLSMRVNNTQETLVMNPNGKLSWNANSVISFTYDEDCNDGYGAWIMNSAGTTTVTADDVFNAIGDLKAMTFKGTVGSAGSIRYLPAQPSAGDTYKVAPSYIVTAASSATGEQLTAKEGDLLTAVLDNNVVKWVLIPSGNDTDLFIQKGENNSTLFLQGNSNWVNLQSDPVADLTDGGVLEIDTQVFIQGVSPT